MLCCNFSRSGRLRRWDIIIFLLSNSFGSVCLCRYMTVGDAKRRGTGDGANSMMIARWCNWKLAICERKAYMSSLTPSDLPEDFPIGRLQNTKGSGLLYSGRFFKSGRESCLFQGSLHSSSPPYFQHSTNSIITKTKSVSNDTRLRLQRWLGLPMGKA